MLNFLVRCCVGMLLLVAGAEREARKEEYRCLGFAVLNILSLFLTWKHWEKYVLKVVVWRLGGILLFVWCLWGHRTRASYCKYIYGFCAGLKIEPCV